MTKDEALKLALEALQTSLYPQQKQLQAITAIKEALAQPEQEPVAYLDEGLGAFYWAKDYKKHVGFKPLYTTQPHRKPLTEEEIEKIWWETKPYFDKHDFTRAIEAAHGIKE